MNDIKFFLSRDDNEWLSIEDEWSGVKYLKCNGLEAIGKPVKYTESYADAQGLRIHEPDDALYEPTDVTFTFLFVGENRKKAYAMFYDYVMKGKFYYYDTKRYKKALFALTEAVTPSDDEYKGSTPYMKADFKFKNLLGRTIDVSV